MTTEAQEQTIASTAFGTVTNRRVTYYYKKGWFNPGSREDLPLRHITSVRLESERHIIAVLILAAIGVGSMAAGAAGVLVGLVFLAIAALLLWGSPKVIVNTAGGDLRPASGFPWTKGDAQEFVGALHAQLFRE